MPLQTSMFCWGLSLPALWCHCTGCPTNTRTQPLPQNTTSPKTNDKKHPLAAKLHTSPLPHAIFSQNPEASNNPWHGWQPTEKKKQKGDKPLCAVLQGAANQQIYCKGDCWESKPHRKLNSCTSWEDPIYSHTPGKLLWCNSKFCALRSCIEVLLLLIQSVWS